MSQYLGLLSLDLALSESTALVKLPSVLVKEHKSLLSKLFRELYTNKTSHCLIDINYTTHIDDEILKFIKSLSHEYFNLCFLNVHEYLIDKIQNELKTPNINFVTDIIYNKFQIKPYTIKSSLSKYKKSKLDLFYAEGMILALWGDKIRVVPYITSESIQSQDIYFDSNIISSRKYLQIASILEEFEYLINNEKISESILHKFINRNPEIILGINSNSIKSKIVLYDDQMLDSGQLIPDFFIKTPGDDYWEIMEIKKPIKKIINFQKNREDFVYTVHNGIAQLRKYSQYFENPQNRMRLEAKYRIKILKPKLSLLVGRYPSTKMIGKYIELKSNYPNINLSTYDELLRRARDKLNLFEYLNLKL